MSSSDRPNRYTYKDAGVDIDAGNALVKAIGPLARSTARSGADGSLGGFGGLFDLKEAGFTDPVLVAANDGVGTKLRIAIESGIHGTVGIDLVAMCVNDLIVQGAEPLFFLDYFATGKLAVGIAEDVVAGIADGCRQAGCALIGGETAEMPGMYAEGDYDLAGFAVGAAERGTLLPRADIGAGDVLIGGETAEMPGMYAEGDYDLAGFAVGAAERGTLLPRADIGAGDVLIGLASSGVHSNGYSLVRRLVSDHELSYGADCPFAPGTSLGAALLTPTRIYVKPLLAAIKETGAVKAMAHITGGGFTENIPRVLPDNLMAEIDGAAWSLPPVFRWLMKLGGIERDEMGRTFNCGIGMVLAVEAERAKDVTVLLERDGETVFTLGTLKERAADAPHVVINGELGSAPAGAA